MYKKRFFLIIFFVFISYILLNGKENRVCDTVRLRTVSEKLKLADFEWIHKGSWNSLYKIPVHPVFDILCTEKISDSLLADINSRKKIVGDTLNTARFFYIWKPYFEWLRSIDPHYMVCPAIIFNIDYEAENYKQTLIKLSKNFSKKAKILPVNVLNVNDTLVIEASLEEKLKKGDIIISINGVNTKEILHYNYSQRHSPLYLLMTYYAFDSIEDIYDMIVLRNGERISLKISGKEYEDALYRLALMDELDKNIRMYDENIGYIKISSFYPDNSRLIRLVRKNILQFKNKGCNSVILDLRGNTGGNGHSFDKLLSMFIDKPVIDYCLESKIKVSKAVLREYDFLTENMIGKVIALPEKIANKTFHLDNKLYIRDIDYYVIMDEGTQSMAATFCNILQFNDAAILVGEPLLKNAFTFGDTIDSGRYFYSWGKFGRNRCFKNGFTFYAGLMETGISTTQTNENTKATDGILQPDISIDYDIRELSVGNDNVLNTLIEIIKAHKKEKGNTKFPEVN